ncbi:hypothetical protein [Actinocrispum sp. NPDC049592]|uniref:hypothetical protein n=1 Tax=Actinocrispum sp. NPDC049592 TaxID=3154835 RepID=UPI00343AE86A
MTERRQRFVLYGSAAAVVVVLLIIALLSWRSSKADKEAERKAAQLTAALSAAGAQTPPADQVVRLLGTDGGSVCAAPNEALVRAAALAGLSNGAGGPGTRPVIADGRLLNGELLVISIYCPDKLPEFQQFVDGLATTDGEGG